MFLAFLLFFLMPHIIIMYLALEILFVSALFFFFFLTMITPSAEIQVYFLFLLVLIAVETAIGLSLLVKFFRRK